MRQVILDVETTGLSTAEGHRVLSIGCVELLNRRISDRFLHLYVNPQRDIDQAALAVHGIGPDFLKDKPLFREIITTVIDFCQDAQLVIHNAPFDVGFLNYEFQLAGSMYGKITDYCTVLDTLVLARDQYPGKRNTLDALCKRYHINTAHRQFHGALLDAQLLAQVYLRMTGGGQAQLFSEHHAQPSSQQDVLVDSLARTLSAQTVEQELNLVVCYADEAEVEAHEALMKNILSSRSGSAVGG